MRYLTAQMVADAINRVPSPVFDSHDVEKGVLQLHSVWTAKEILHQRRSGDALRCFSAAFAKYVDQTFAGAAGQIQKTTKVKSENLGGEVSLNQQWRKLVATIVPPLATDGSINDGTGNETPDEERRQRAIRAVGLRNAASRAIDEL
jgi:hypothetical protein